MNRHFLSVCHYIPQGREHPAVGYAVLAHGVGGVPAVPSLGSQGSLWLQSPLLETQERSPQLSQIQHILITWQSPKELFPHLWVTYLIFPDIDEGIRMTDICPKGKPRQGSLPTFPWHKKLLSQTQSWDHLYLLWFHSWNIYFTLYKALQKTSQEE